MGMKAGPGMLRGIKKGRFEAALSIFRGAQAGVPVLLKPLAKFSKPLPGNTLKTTSAKHL
jgi:hypothetical protein